jgi:hypothetical protein
MADEVSERRPEMALFQASGLSPPPVVWCRTQEFRTNQGTLILLRFFGAKIRCKMPLQIDLYLRARAFLD